MDGSFDEPANDVDLRSVIAILRRQIRVIGYSAAAILGLAAVFLIAATETYTATALILVDPNGKSILSPQQSFSNSAGQDDAHVDSQVEILRSDAVALDVIAKFGLIADAQFGARVPVSERFFRAVGIANANPVSHDRAVAKTLIRFQDATSIRRRGLTYVISVSTTSPSPEQAAILANALAGSYISQEIDAKIADTLAARNILRQQMQSSTTALASYETALNKIVSQNLDVQGASSAHPVLTGLRVNLLTAETRRENAKAVENQARGFLQQENWAGLATNLEDEVLGHLGRERETLLARMTDQQNPDPAANLHSALAEIDARLSTQTTSRLATMGSTIRVLDQEISDLRQQVRQEFLTGDLPPETLAAIYTVQQESSIARDQYQNLLSRMRDLDTEARIQVANARIVSPALAPVSASFPNRSLVLLAAIAASLGVGISLAFLKEYYIGGVTSTTQLGELLQTPATVTVPQNLEQGSGRLGIADDIIDAPLSVYSESIRKLKAALDQSFRKQNSQKDVAVLSSGKVVLVTSALENEGKTSTALAVARTFAQSGRKTLLIDADLRRPSLHRQLGFEPQAGFLEYLNGDLDADKSGTFYARDPCSSLALIMGAERSEFPTDQLLCSARFETLLNQAKDIYEIIVIDSPPLLPVVDARYIAHHADCVALVVKWASTSQSDLRTAVQPLREAMGTSATLIPILSQTRDQSKYHAHAEYYSRYSAAI